MIVLAVPLFPIIPLRHVVFYHLCTQAIQAKAMGIARLIYHCVTLYTTGPHAGITHMRVHCRPHQIGHTCCHVWGMP